MSSSRGETSGNPISSNSATTPFGVTAPFGATSYSDDSENWYTSSSSSSSSSSSVTKSPSKKINYTSRSSFSGGTPNPDDYNENASLLSGNLNYVTSDVIPNYLEVFVDPNGNDKKQQALLNKYGLQLNTANSLIHQHRKYYRARRYEMMVAIGSDVGYSGFQILTSRDGAEGAAQLIAGNGNSDKPILSDSLAISFGIPGALLDLAFNMIAVSPSQAAIQLTLDYAHSKPLKEQAADLIKHAKENPKEAAIDFACWSFHKSVLYIHNGFGASANALPLYEPVKFSWPMQYTIPAFMPLIPTWAEYTTVSIFVYGGNRYYSVFSNADYYEGAREFWGKSIYNLWNNVDDGKPWLVGEVRRGKYAVPLQVAAQGGISTVLMRKLQYYYICRAALQMIAKMQDPENPQLPSFTAQCLAFGLTFPVDVHSFCVRYPMTYMRYFGNRIEINELKKAHEVRPAIPNNNIPTAVMNQIPENARDRVIAASANNSNPFTLTVDQAAINKINPFEDKEGVVKPVFWYRAMIGFLIAHKAIAPTINRGLNVNIGEDASFMSTMVYGAVTTTSMLLTGLFLAAPFYKAEKLRLQDEEELRQLKAQVNAHNLQNALESGQGIQPPEAEDKPSKSDKYATFITVGSQVARGLSTLGSANRIFGNSKPMAMGATAIIAVEQVINGTMFTLPKTKSTLRGWSMFKENSAIREVNLRAGNQIERLPGDGGESNGILNSISSSVSDCLQSVKNKMGGITFRRL